MQDPETQHNVEALAELAHVQRVHMSVLDPRSDQPRDCAEADTVLKRHAEASTHPVDILVIVDRDHAPRAADLRKEAVEAIERADVEHATARETIRAEHRKAVAVIAGGPRRVDPGREREGVNQSGTESRTRSASAADAPIAWTSPTTRSAADVSGIDSTGSTTIARAANAPTPVSRSHDRHTSITVWRQRLQTSDCPSAGTAPGDPRNLGLGVARQRRHASGHDRTARAR